MSYNVLSAFEHVVTSTSQSEDSSGMISVFIGCVQQSVNRKTFIT
jgi:hypothetical protein